MKKLLALFLLAVLFFGACRKNDKLNYLSNTGEIGTTIPTNNTPVISNAAIADYLVKNPISQFVAIDWSKARQATIDGKNIVRVPTLNIDKSPKAGANKLQVAATKTTASGIAANYYPEHPPELFFIQDPKSTHPDSIYTMMVNFIPTDKTKEFGKDSIWTGKLYDWDLNSATLHVQELQKSKVNKTYALVLNNIEDNAHKQHINSVWTWLGGVLSDIWDAINYVAYYIGIPGAYIDDPNVPGGYLIRTWDFFGGGGGSGGDGSSDSPYSGQFFIDGVYSNYIPGYNGSYGSDWNTYPTGDPCAGSGQNVASAKLKLQQLPGSGSPCDPSTVVPTIDYSSLDTYTGDEEDPDDDAGDYTGPTQHIPSQITLNNGQIVSVEFGTTLTDHLSADNPVSVKLVNLLIEALNRASQHITIKSIFIMATTNGKHSNNPPIFVSNHYRSLAIDLSRINGIPMSVSGDTNEVTQMQLALDQCPDIRENFGPHFKHKFGQPYNTNDGSDHIHFSTNP